MPDTDAIRHSQTKGEGDALEPGPPTPRLYSLTTRYTDQFLDGQDGPDLLCDDAIAALHFALTVSSSSPLAITCSATADGRTWTRLPLHVLRADAVNALRQDVKPPMYAVAFNNPRTTPNRPRPGRMTADSAHGARARRKLRSGQAIPVGVQTSSRRPP
ncbi:MULTISPECIES: hypothetical protein [Streptomyces]|uniref:Uncharacterized protein n=1 Tax=Streptomyces flaveolus TaxID=67297 RepID=A0ABV3ANX1_9ACTN|nr:MULTISPECIES: hypothetical protein [Streptomyces]KOG59435.1 hypothetical protein ADK77_39915 [Streptomyces antibioticus]